MGFITPTHAWEETDSEVTVRVDIKGVPRSSLDVFASSCYLKVNAPPYLFSCDLEGEIDDAACVATVDAAGVADLFGDMDLDLEHAASDAEVAAAAEAEKTLAVALSNPAAADALRSKRAERAGAELADELAAEEVFEDARDGESDDDNW